jgi:VWFA-related protein
MPTFHPCANQQKSDGMAANKALRDRSSSTFDPLYLFTCCCLVWRNEGNEQARLEVARALNSPHRCARKIAATLLLRSATRTCEVAAITFGQIPSTEAHRKIRALTSAILLVVASSVLAIAQSGQRSNPSQPSSGEVQIPHRPVKSLFRGQQGKQHTEIYFDGATGVVTMKLLVQDSNGYFIPNLRADNFIVYENGARQQLASAAIERAPASIGLLLEFANPMPGLGEALQVDISDAAHQLVRAIEANDDVTAWKYNDRVDKLGDWDDGREVLDKAVLFLDKPGPPVANLYDALLYALPQMPQKQRRNALVLISDGIDSDSKASYRSVVTAAENSGVPIYVISMTNVAKQYMEAHPDAGPMVKVDWSKAERELQEIAQASGGRVYVPSEPINLSTTYDDLLENLKVRYVLTYRSSASGDSPRTVRVELANPRTGGLLQIVDKEGHPIRAMVVAQDSYSPAQASKSAPGNSARK